mmetsp:Transcript_110396/g.246710  ORF Transcript_110396/g.246710 Transcript_110396/m.246710 type:complete len:216 (-) Transcript_110396:25-672(-)
MLVMQIKLIAAMMVAIEQKSAMPPTGKKLPQKKARVLQTDVSTTPGPALAMTSPMISPLLCWSISSIPRSEKYRSTTNMSSTPRPSASKGMASIIGSLRYLPQRKKMPKEVNIAKITTHRPHNPTRIRLAKGCLKANWIDAQNMKIRMRLIMRYPPSKELASSSSSYEGTKLETSRSTLFVLCISQTLRHSVSCNFSAVLISSRLACAGFVRLIL